MSRSSNASRYGRLAERHAAETYDLRVEGVHTSWRDAVRDDGTSVEIKATMRERADGSRGRFRVFREYHDRLRAVGGWYCFVLYRPHGRGIRVLKTRMLPASQLPLSAWYGAGGHRDSQQTKLSPAAVFG